MAIFASVSEVIGDDEQLAGLQSELGDDVLVTLVDMAVTNAKTGLDQIKAAVAANDPVLLRETAHSLKGASSSLCAVRFSQMAAAIETHSAEIEQVKANYPEFEEAATQTVEWWQSKRPC